MKISIPCSFLLATLFATVGISHSQSLQSRPDGLAPFSENAANAAGSFTKAGSTEAVDAAFEASFRKKFGDVTGVIWTKISRNHMRAYFQNDGITVRAGFNRKGKLIYTMRYYLEENLPQEIIYRIKSNYSGRNIFGVTEVSMYGKTAYLVDLEDKTSWLRIKILGDEITEEHSFTKR